MKVIPWKKVKSWRCLKCGRCCSGFRVDLRPFEYARIIRFRPDAILLDRFGNPYLKKNGNKCVFLNDYGQCGLQLFQMKPFACKIWPFAVYVKPKDKGLGKVKNAEFGYKNEDFYVYLNPHFSICPGINKGSHKELQLTIAEIIEICFDPLRKQFYSTSRL